MREMLRYEVLAVVHQRKRNLLDTDLWRYSHEHMDVIRQDGRLINRETMPGRNLYPVVGQSLTSLRTKYSSTELGSKNKVMIQIEGCMRGGENLRFCSSELEYWRKRALVVAMMLSLVREVALHRLNSDAPGATRKITARPKRRCESEFLAYRG